MGVNIIRLIRRIEEIPLSADLLAYKILTALGYLVNSLVAINRIRCRVCFAGRKRSEKLKQRVFAVASVKIAARLAVSRRLVKAPLVACVGVHIERFVCKVYELEICAVLNAVDIDWLAVFCRGLTRCVNSQMNALAADIPSAIVVLFKAVKSIGKRYAQSGVAAVAAHICLALLNNTALG